MRSNALFRTWDIRQTGSVVLLLLLTAGACDPVQPLPPTTSEAGASGEIPRSTHADGLLTGTGVSGGGPVDAGATTVAEVASLVIMDLEHFWSTHWTAAYPNIPFAQPSGYGLYERGEVPEFACASPTDNPQAFVNNAFYCPRDSSIVLESQWMGELWAEQGDFGPAALIAHEWGHHVQNLLGDLQDPIFSIQAELQADCFAGVWARNAGKSGAFTVNAADIDEAAATFYSIGHESQIGWFAPGAHGTPTERHNAMQLGYGGVDATTCDNVANYRIDQTLQLDPYVIGLLDGDAFTTRNSGAVDISGPNYVGLRVQAQLMLFPSGTAASTTLPGAMRGWAADATAPHGSNLYPYHAIEDLTDYTMAARVPGTATGFSYAQIYEKEQVHGYFFHHNSGSGWSLVIDVFRPGEPPLEKAEWADLVAVVWRMILGFQISGT